MRTYARGTQKIERTKSQAIYRNVAFCLSSAFRSHSENLVYPGLNIEDLLDPWIGA